MLVKFQSTRIRQINLELSALYIYIYFKYILLIMLFTVAPFPPFTPLHPAHPPLSHIPPFSSCPWVIRISSLASPFPILFLTSPSIFYPPFMLLTLCTFSPSLPTYSPAYNPPCDLHFCDSIPVLVVCLVGFCFCFRCGC